MPVVEPKIAKTLEAMLVTELTNAFAGPDAPDDQADSHKKLAGAIAKAVANAIATTLLQDAKVAPGIAITGVGGGVPGPVSGATTAPGSII